MTRTVVAVIAAALALAGCGSDDATDGGPTREEYCASFAAITPGFYESQRDVEILSDESSSAAERAEAMKNQLSPERQRTAPYDCDDPADAEFFDEFVEGAEKARESEGAEP